MFSFFFLFCFFLLVVLFLEGFWLLSIFMLGVFYIPVFFPFFFWLSSLWIIDKNYFFLFDWLVWTSIVFLGVFCFLSTIFFASVISGDSNFDEFHFVFEPFNLFLWGVSFVFFFGLLICIFIIYLYFLGP